MGTRETILAGIRRRQGRGGDRPAQAELQELGGYLSEHPRGPAPGIEGDLVARFRARAEANASTTERVASEREVPAAVARYLATQGLPNAGCVWPQLGRLDWTGAGLALEPRAANGADAVGVSGVFCALAETGTLVVVSAPATPSTVSLLPETHVAVVPVARLVAHMEDAWELLRAELGQLPRAVNFISGP
ncbi:MAG TPA: lactate utilization protein, partial [Burkholderiales bacterium]|nr:lactate utilization protein [Burkholderiales bacterium]